MKMYADYILERQGLSLLTSEHGFIAYSLNGEECFVAELFIRKEYRRAGFAKELFKELLQICLNAKCKIITANIHLWDRGANNTLKAIQTVGFEITGAQNGVLLVSKKITED